MLIKAILPAPDASVSLAPNALVRYDDRIVGVIEEVLEVTDEGVCVLMDVEDDVLEGVLRTGSFSIE